MKTCDSKPRVIVRFIAGAVAIGCGLAIIGWICYNEVIERLPQYTGFHWWEPFGGGSALIGVGWYWLRTPRAKDRTS